MLSAIGSPTLTLTEEDARRQVALAAEATPLDGKRVLVIIPDGTRTAPIPMLFRVLNETFGARAAAVDYLIALGTHPPMSEEAIARLVGMTARERERLYPRTRIFNHAWDDPARLATIGVIAGEETRELTGGMLAEPIPVALNSLILDYDQLVICGPVFPHEVAGFSGGAKYLFPGIAGPQIIDSTHWLGALRTSMDTIGVKETPVRRVIHRAATFVPRPVLCVALVMHETTLHGLYIGNHLEAFAAAADLSAQLNITWLDHPVQRVLSCPAERYDDLWTAAKAMYKTEPVVADGGEVIIYAPHITEVSYTHGRLIDQVGYHVRDYFLKQWDRFRDTPGMILAHSTHVKGKGTYDAATGVESPRIQVTLATGIPEERCRRINLGYRDYRTLDPRTWADGDDESLYAPHAGETLYRLRA
ncbi:MAG TPA: lactate racemase domain-containing protein [Ktedonobacterales bacterium]|nr:lactate racemase domain-containing protein [Ktedonobacterales bacterium]